MNHAVEKIAEPAGQPEEEQVRVTIEEGFFLAFFDQNGRCLGRKPWSQTGIPNTVEPVAFLLAHYGSLSVAKSVLIDGLADPQVYERRAYQAAMEAGKAWKANWPDHCKTCDGTGGTCHPATRFSPEDFTTCPDCVDQCKCPRCGKAQALNEDAEGPCSTCGWNYDDACPRY